MGTSINTHRYAQTVVAMIRSEHPEELIVVTNRYLADQQKAWCRRMTLSRFPELPESQLGFVVRWVYRILWEGEE